MNSLFSINSPLWEATDKLLHLLWLSILWAIYSLPIITIGASTTALYSVTLKYVRNEEGYLTSSFRKAFRQNLRQSSAIWGLSMIIGGLLFADFVIYYRNGVENAVSVIFFTVFMGVFVTFLFANIYLYPLLAYFDNTIRHTIVNALVMAVSHLPSSIAMMTFSFAVLTAGILFFPPLLFVMPGMTAYFNSRLLRKLFDRYQARSESI